jgi:hypothetical protein
MYCINKFLNCALCVFIFVSIVLAPHYLGLEHFDLSSTSKNVLLVPSNLFLFLPNRLFLNLWLESM